MNKKFIEVQEAKQMTGLGRTTLWKLRKENKIKWFKVGRKVLILKSSLIEYIESNGSQFKGSEQLINKKNQKYES